MAPSTSSILREALDLPLDRLIDLKSLAGKLGGTPIPLESLGKNVFVVSFRGKTILIGVPDISSQGPIPLTEVLDPVFVPPTFLSVPLPLVSGARAFAFAGAFTAIADDATAAAINPAGLTQLERPELSAVYRSSDVKLTYKGGDDSFRPRNIRVRSDGLNFLSAVVPTRIGNRPFVLSLNTHESYDTRSAFQADTRQVRSEVFEDTRSETIQLPVSGEQTLSDGRTNFRVEGLLQTEINQRLRQELEQSSYGSVEYEQRGVIEAISPAAALQFTPSISGGIGLKFFQDEVIGPPIRSIITTRNTVETRQRILRETERISRGLITATGTLSSPGQGARSNVAVPIPQGVDLLPETRDIDQSESEIVRFTQTYLQETETLTDLTGRTLTLGLLMDITPKLALGVAFDSGWTAEATRERVRDLNIVSRDGNGRVLAEQEERTFDREKVEIDFPLHTSVGVAFRPSPDFLASCDIGYRRYSDFAARGADGIDRNPFTGTPLADDPLDDTWRVAFGVEALVPVGRRFIPLRAGYQWEEIPAPDKPDPYHSVSVGTGWVGDRVVIDFSYQHRWADDVTTPVPSRQDISADARQDFFGCSILFYF